jgi:hypothetical protein
MVLMAVKLEGFMRRTSRRVEGYLDLFDDYENILSLRYYLFGRFCIWSKTVFTEDVPEFAVIQQATLGHTSWRSKRPALITASQMKKTVKTFFI